MVQLASTFQELISLGVTGSTPFTGIVKVEYQKQDFYFITHPARLADTHKLLLKTLGTSKDQQLFRELKTRVQIGESKYTYIVFPSQEAIEVFCDEIVEKELAEA